MRAAVIVLLHQVAAFIEGFGTHFSVLVAARTVLETGTLVASSHFRIKAGVKKNHWELLAKLKSGGHMDGITAASARRIRGAGNRAAHVQLDPDAAQLEVRDSLGDLCIFLEWLYG
jgi:hypothetical protein